MQFCIKLFNLTNLSFYTVQRTGYFVPFFHPTSPVKGFASSLVQQFYLYCNFYFIPSSRAKCPIRSLSSTERIGHLAREDDFIHASIQLWYIFILYVPLSPRSFFGGISNQAVYFFVISFEKQKHNHFGQIFDMVKKFDGVKERK